MVTPQFLYMESFTPEGRIDMGAAGDEVVNGFVNTRERCLFPITMKYAPAFLTDWPLIRQNGLFGYINTDYDIAIPPQYEFAGDFGEGVAYGEKDGSKYIIDKSGGFC